VSGIWNEPDNVRVLNFIPRLTGLTTLDLLNCSGAINDRTLQSIYIHLTQLISLQFTHCNVTDLGFGGGESDEEGQLLGINSLSSEWVFNTFVHLRL